MEKKSLSLDEKVTIGIAVALVLAAAASRVLPHPWNCTPVIGMALFGGAKLPKTWWAVAMTLVSLAIGDMILGVFPYAGILWVYGTLAAIVLVGRLLKDRTDLARPLIAALASGALFFVVTNFGYWATGNLYPKTAAGLVTCFVAGLPFYRSQLIGDIGFTAAFFGLYALAQRSVRSRASLAG